jgi:CDP-diacylglycerol--glycerol-3-phosphate 3-phosphatidyltransferase
VSTAERQKPLVTANQVTVARLVPMPLIAWLIYQGQGGWWTAVVIAFFVGSTDYLDGYLARKHGPTTLGALLDPLADKIFLAFMYVPLADLRFLMATAVAMMFARELLVTAMRSAYLQRNIQFETSYLAKFKTWVQMQAVGTFMLIGLLPRTGDLVALFGVLALSVVTLIALRVVKGRFYRNLWVGSAFALWPPLLYLFAIDQGDQGLFVHGATWVVVGLTWASGLDYLVGGLKRLRAAGGFRRADAVRVVAGGALPLLALTALVQTDAPAWAILAVMAFELALGGLDNLLSVHGRAAPALPWGARAFGAVALLGLAVLFPAHAVPAAIAAAVVSGIGAIIEFWRSRDVYMDQVRA